MPTLWVGPKDRQDKILLPMELCRILPDQVTNRKMNEEQTSAMIKKAATNTIDRKAKIMDSISRAQYNQNETVKEFGFHVGSDFERIDARVLEPPILAYANNESVRPSRGAWKADRSKFIKPATFSGKWTIVSADSRPVAERDVSEFIKQVKQITRVNGMNVVDEPVRPYQHIRGGLQEFKRVFQKLEKDKYTIVFVIVPNSNSSPQYAYVKSAAELHTGVLTQCIKYRTLTNTQRNYGQTVANILLKVNSKLNGINHHLYKTLQIMCTPTMIMGADVTHPSPDAQHIPSVAAVTASHDPKFFGYNICWRLQPPRMEIIGDLKRITVEHLKFFYHKNRGCKPVRIIFFRDGVSEGQFEEVRRAEIAAIQSACKLLEENYQPKITFLVVQKRHHTRLFPVNQRDSEDKNFNVPAGTIVDKEITNPTMQDFYLVSHGSIQGVSKPTKYCTLHDDNDFDHDTIEELTFHLCHMFARCNRSVSYPAPTYYAHLAAARAKVYIENVNLNMDQLEKEQERYNIRDEIRKDLPMFFV